MNTLRLPGPLDLSATLYSGQAFRWRPGRDGWHEGWILNRPVLVRARGPLLQWRSPLELSRDAVGHYFRLDPAHDEFLASLPDEPYLARALRRFPGLRLLRQDPWELFVCFIISQNSNEAKIRRSVQALCLRAGEPLEWGGRAWHAFPTPQALAGLTEAELRQAGLGYRAPFVWSASRSVLAGRFDPRILSSVTYEVAFERLLEQPGIGPKVADCILLYGCDHRAAFPTDVWVKRFLRETYHQRRTLARHDLVQRFAQKTFGPQAGYAQHYLFHYRRSVGMLETSPS